MSASDWPSETGEVDYQLGQGSCNSRVFIVFEEGGVGRVRKLPQQKMFVCQLVGKGKKTNEHSKPALPSLDPGRRKKHQFQLLAILGLRAVERMLPIGKDTVQLTVLTRPVS